MKISLSWLREYVEIDETPEELSEILTALGLEVEGMEEVESIKGGLKGLKVGKVVECGKHPNADKLSLTKIDIGEDQLLQIVCGAPNVKADQKVVVATVGTVLHPTSGDSFKIKKGKIRGEVSEGMICAEDEIGIGESHDGIIVLPSETVVGINVSSYYNVDSDIVYEIGLTPNRSDATSHIGVARDLAAYYSFNKSNRSKVKYPNIAEIEQIAGGSIKVKVEDSNACPRYSGVSLKEIVIQASPKWIQDRLKAIDVRPINNVVDITNYVLHEYGQPLHAFDLNQIAKSEIVVKKMPAGSKFTSLDEVERTLFTDDLMICDGDGQGMCIGGVFGGVKSGVTDITDHIFLEAAHFEAQGIRKTSTKHNLRTDAAKCFEKGSDPNVTIKALKRAIDLLCKYANAKVDSEIIDIYNNKIEPKSIKLRLAKVNQVIGNDFTEEQLQNILSALDMKYESQLSGEYVVQVPTNKADVTREVDLIEEILRIYGFNNVEIDNRIHSTINVSNGLSRYELRNKISQILVGKGFHEMMGLSLIPSEAYSENESNDEFVLINNTSNVGLDLMRPDMLISVLNTVKYNFNRQQSDLRLFEFGKSYIRGGDGFLEKEGVAIIMTGFEQSSSWLKEKKSVDFYSLKKVVLELLISNGIENYQMETLEEGNFDYGMRYYRGKQEICRFGAVSEHVLSEKDIKDNVYYAEFNIQNIHSAMLNKKMKVKDISKFPSSRRDLSFVLDKSIEYADLEKIVLKSGKGLIDNVNLFDHFVNEEAIGKNKKSYAIGMTFVSNESNLNDKQLDKVVNNIINTAKDKLGAELR